MVQMQEWSYFRGGLSTIDRDYGIFNKIHHDIGTHVVHHLFPQMPHYNLCEATAASPALTPPFCYVVCYEINRKPVGPGSDF